MIDKRTFRLVKGGRKTGEAERDARPKGDEFVGACPHCGRYDSVLNVGRRHWAYCSVHGLYWWVGDNLFSKWRDEDESVWAANRLILTRYCRVTGS